MNREEQIGKGEDMQELLEILDMSRCRSSYQPSEQGQCNSPLGVTYLV